MDLRSGFVGIIAVSAVSSACATVTFEPKLDPVPTAARKSALAIRTESMVDAIERMPEPEAAEVRVVLASEPGIEIVEGDVNVKVDPSRYELLGQVRADYRAHFLADIGFWTYTYREDER